MLTNIPDKIDGAKVLYISKSNTGFEIVVIDGYTITIEFISICQYDHEEGYYLFGCDKDFNTHTDFYYEDIGEALDDAKRLYQTDNIIWTQISV